MVNDKKIAKQLIEYQKAAFENAFNSLTALQMQTEKIAQDFLAQAVWLPEDGKKVINEWVDMYKKGRIDFKASIDNSYASVEKFFTEDADQPKPKTTRKK